MNRMALPHECRDSLSRDDLDFLESACGKRVHAGESLFGPESATWHINREACLLLGGGRALLLQVAHPLVAAGVAAHSRFREEPLLRLWRTLDLMVTIVFGDAAQAAQALHAIEWVHQRVRGTLNATVGPFPRGTPYSAGDPELLLWVHSTLVDTALLAHSSFVGTTTEGLAYEYYAEAKVIARLFRVPEALIPPTLGDFRLYVNDIMNSDVLSIGDAGREIARSILRPPLVAGLRHAIESTRLVTAALLPAALRQRYGLLWSHRRKKAFDAFAAAVRTSLPVMPRSLRYLPQSSRGIGSSTLAMAVRFAGLRAA